MESADKAYQVILNSAEFLPRISDVGSVYPSRCPEKRIGCNQNWLRQCGPLEAKYSENDLSFCTVDPAKTRLSLESSKCIEGITDAIANSVLGPAMLALAAADFLEKYVSSCKGNTHELREEIKKANSRALDRERSFMKSRFKEPISEGTWESLTCAQIRQIKFCRSIQQVFRPPFCSEALRQLAAAETNFQSSVYSKPVGNREVLQEIQPIADQSTITNGIIQARIKQCDQFKTQDQYGKNDRIYIKYLRQSIAEDGSCLQAFDSIAQGLRDLNLQPLPDSRNSRMANVTPDGCFSNQYLNKRYCEIAANLISLMTPVGEFAVGRAASRLSTKTMAASRAEQVLSRRLTRTETAAVERAHKIGVGGKGETEGQKIRRFLNSKRVNIEKAIQGGHLNPQMVEVGNKLGIFGESRISTFQEFGARYKALQDELNIPADARFEPVRMRREGGDGKLEIIPLSSSQADTLSNLPNGGVITPEEILELLAEGKFPIGDATDVPGFFVAVHDLYGHLAYPLTDWDVARQIRHGARQALETRRRFDALAPAERPAHLRPDALERRDYLALDELVGSRVNQAKMDETIGIPNELANQKHLTVNQLLGTLKQLSDPVVLTRAKGVFQSMPKLTDPAGGDVIDSLIFNKNVRTSDEVINLGQPKEITGFNEIYLDLAYAVRSGNAAAARVALARAQAYLHVLSANRPANWIQQAFRYEDRDSSFFFLYCRSGIFDTPDPNNPSRSIARFAFCK